VRGRARLALTALQEPREGDTITVSLALQDNGLAADTERK
jgi:hypothetical protein